MKSTKYTNHEPRTTKHIAILLSLIIVWLILPQAAQAATYYCDAAQAGMNHAGTEADPYSEVDMNNVALDWGPGDTIYCKGSFGTMDLRNRSYGAEAGGYVTWAAWPGFVPDANYIIGPGSAAGDAIDVYLTIDGWKLDRGWSASALSSTVLIYRAGYFTITNCTISTWRWSLVTSGELAPYPISNAGIDDGYGYGLSHHITITNNTFRNCFQGIRVAGQNYTITGNSFDEHISSDGIVATADCDTVLIADNTFSDHNNLYGLFGYNGNSAGSEAWDGHEGELIVHNTSGDTGYFYDKNAADNWFRICPTALATAPGTHYASGTKWELDSDPNVFWTCGGSGDSAHVDGIEAVGGDDDGYIIIERNRFGDWFEGSGGGIRGQALKLQDNGEDPYIIFRNNIIYMVMDSGYALLLSGPGGDIQIYHNIIIVPNHYSYAARIHYTTRHVYNNIISGVINDYSIDVDADYNIWFNPPGEGSGKIPSELQGSHDQYSVDPATLFVDYAGLDFNTLSASSAIDAGDVNYTDTTDYTGVANVRVDNAPPDIGAYEYSPSEILLGDVNADSEISAFDAALAAYIAVDLEHLEIKNRAAAEVSGDSEVTAYDAALIAQRAVGLIDKFPVE